MIPNGVRCNAAGTKLYATDYTGTLAYGPANLTYGSGITYEYDLDEEVRPINKRPLLMARTSGVDGIHLDDYDRIWTAEDDGIWVRTNTGRVLGMFNTVVLKDDSLDRAITAQFSLAGDTLVVLSHTRIWTVKLAQPVVKRGNLS